MFNFYSSQPNIQQMSTSENTDFALKQKVSHYGKQIRQQQREKKRQQMRKILHLQLLAQSSENSPNEVQQIQQHELIFNPSRFMELLQKQNNDPKFIWQNVQGNEYFLMDFLLANSENLIRISFENSTAVNDDIDIDEKQLPSKNKNSQLQEVNLPKQFSFQLQTMLFKEISLDILQTPGKYQKLLKQVQQSLITFCLSYLQRNSYEQTKQQNAYHVSVINFLAMLVTEINSFELRESILKWVEGPSSLSLIYNCLQGHFLNYKKFTNIYKIISAGLNQKLLSTKLDAIDVLLKCIKVSDQYHISTLLSYRPQIFTSLLKMFKNKKIDRRLNINANDQIVNCLIKTAQCVNLFLCSHDEHKFQCLQQGAGHLGAKLICQNNVMLIKQGFQILTKLAGIEDEYYKRQAQNFILKSNQIRTFVQQYICKTDEIFSNENIEIREYFLEFLSVFFVNSGVDEGNSFYLMFPKNRSLIDVLIDIFVVHVEENTLVNILKVFQSIFYYGQGNSQQISELNEWSEGQRDEKEQAGILIKLKIPVVLSQMDQRGMIGKIRQLLYHTEESTDSELRALLEFIMDLMNKEY